MTIEAGQFYRADLDGKLAQVIHTTDTWIVIEGEDVPAERVSRVTFEEYWREEKVMTKPITVYYSPDLLMLNAPRGAHPGRSISRLLYRLNRNLAAGGYYVSFTEGTGDCWNIQGADALDLVEIVHEVDAAVQNDWYVITGTVEQPAAERY